jgi:glutamine amidotransferase
MIALIDYGAGNLTSVKKALAAIGADLVVPTTPDELWRADGVIVPGVGHFRATRALDGHWVDAIRGLVERGRPMLGICLGMQWLFEGSDEAPECPGLALLSGRCVRLRGTSPGSSDLAATPPLKIPHVGWNALDKRREAPLVRDVAAGAQVYFTHSYAAPVTADTVAATEHGEPFAAVVQRDHIAGVQFHPEKSGEVGLTILKNFVRGVGRS